MTITTEIKRILRKKYPEASFKEIHPMGLLPIGWRLDWASKTGTEEEKRIAREILGRQN